MEVSHASLETGFSAAPYPPLPAAGGIISITNIINTATLLGFIRLCSLDPEPAPLVPSLPPHPRAAQSVRVCPTLGRQSVVRPCVRAHVRHACRLTCGACTGRCAGCVQASVQTCIQTCVEACFQLCVQACTGALIQACLRACAQCVCERGCRLGCCHCHTGLPALWSRKDGRGG